MDAPPYRWAERACVALYALVALGSVLAVVRDARTSSPGAGEPVPMGFLAIALFWLCILVAISMVGVLLLVNAVRVARGEGADRVVVALALAVPGALLAALAAIVAFPASRVPLLLALVGLGGVPAGLLAWTFGDRYRRDAAPD